MTNVLEIFRYDSTVVNAYFCMMKRQHGTFFSLAKSVVYLGLPPCCTLRIG